MTTLIADLITYLKTRELSGVLESISSEDMPNDHSIKIALEILRWLKLEANRKKSQPYEIRDGYDWGQTLKSFVVNNEGFRELFKVVGRKLTYNDELSLDSRKLIQQLAFEASKNS